ncbi:MAG: hypothetical protein CM15mP111_2110 [Hyphomicrobiales bacterium]|nr:MAG: hypothetical protein CM15mP111_2110 [Hyphomicrobiales bacterium]
MMCKTLTSKKKINAYEKILKNELVPDIIIDFDEWEKHSEIYSVIEKATEQTLIYVDNINMTN